MMTETLNGYQLYHAFLAGYFSITDNRENINRINVFPVQDGDTGTNMVGTLKTIALNLESCRSAEELLGRMASLSLEGARGNSGLIVSQYINGLARHARGKENLSVCQLGEVLGKSVEEAYGAVENPREGTILTVMRIWAESLIEECGREKTLAGAMKRSLLATREALRKTPDQLSVLKEHNVVDAGAQGFVNFLEGVANLGERGRISFLKRKKIGQSDLTLESSHSEEVHGHDGALTYRYCTEVLLEGDNLARETIKEQLKGLGDSLIVTMGIGRSRVHIHSDRPNEVVSRLGQKGRILQQKADDMVRQEQIVNRPLGKIGVVTDSIADIPGDLLDKYQIHVMNLSILWDNDEYLDRLTIIPNDFYEMQARRSTFPTSSFPPAAQVERYYQYLLEHYDGLIVLSVAKELSGTWRRMSLSAEKFNGEKKRITVIDTCLNSVAQGLLVKNIASRAAEGAELKELVSLAEDLKKRIKIYVTVKTFKFMIKGGRVSPLKGLVAKALNLKPIVSLDERGKGIAFDKSFSSRGLSKKIARLVRRTSLEKGIEEYAVVHAAAPGRAEGFSALIKNEIGSEPSYITDISPIVGMHSGKGAVAIGIVESHDGS